MIHRVFKGIFTIALLERVVDPLELAELWIVVFLANHVVASIEVDVRAVGLRMQFPV